MSYLRFIESAQQEVNAAVERKYKMKRIVMIVSALILALNLNLFEHTSANAAANQYDDIAVGEYPITAKALNADKDEESGAAPFIGKSAKLKVSENGVQLTITVPENEMASITGLQIEGVKPSVNGEQWTYSLTSVKPILNAQVQYEVPAFNMKHDVPFRFSLEGLDKLPKKQEPEVEKPETDQGSDSDKNEDESPKEDEKEEPGREDESPKPTPENDAEENNDTSALAKGSYTANVSYLHASKDEASSMGRYLSDPVFFTVGDNATELTIAVNDHKTVTKLTVNGKNAISTKVDGNTRYETFAVGSLTKPVSAYVEYQAPFQGSVHHGNATFRVDVDLANAKQASASDKPGNHISAEYINLADGLYAIDASFLNAKNGNDSAMARYLGDKAYISVKDGKADIYILVNDNGTVTKLKINDKDGIDKIVNGKTTLESFGVTPLVTEMTGYAEYQAPFGDSIHYGKAEFTISLNKATIQKVDKLPIENEGAKEEPKEEEPPKQEKPKQESAGKPVKGYTIDYFIKHSTQDEVSAADNFFVKPGILLQENGKNYLQITINNWRMIDWLKVNGKPVTVIKEDKNTDTAVVQFEVPTDLNEIVPLNMKVTVPGLYETEHDARLVLDAKSLAEDKSGQEYIVHAQSSGNGGATTDDSSLIKKPSFGSNGTDYKASTGKSPAGNHVNPQTGDNSKIMLYGILLLSSAALLTVQYRRRRLNS